MSLPDLIDPPALSQYFDVGAFASLPAGRVAALTASASAAVRRYCNRLFTLRSFDELHTVEAPDREITLRHFPVVDVARVATGPTEVLTLTGPAAAQRAAAGLVRTGDDGTGFAVTGLSLQHWIAGVRTAATVPIDGTTPTVDALAAAARTAAPAWSVSVRAGFGAWAAAEVCGPVGSRPAAGGKAAGFFLYADDVDYGLNGSAGILTLGAGGGGSADSPRWGPSWPGDDDPVVVYGGLDGVRVSYTAGFAAVPADVAGVVAELVKLAAERLGRDTSLRSESDGVLSWTAGEFEVLPAELARRLNPYVNHRA